MSEQQKIWFLCHFKAQQHQDVLETDDIELTRKEVGFYSSRAKAEAAIARLVKQEGFRDYPGGFRIYTEILDKDGWEDGFIEYP